MRTDPNITIHDHRSHLTFVIGQDRKGHWIALETHGVRGGIFATKDDAIDYARLESGRCASAIRLTADALEFKA
jgi:hypothetical protein